MRHRSTTLPETLADIEAFLQVYGLRLRRSGRRDGRSRRYFVTVADARGDLFEASGLDVGEAVKNAVETALMRRVAVRRSS